MQVSLTSNAAEYRDALIDYMAQFRLNSVEALRLQGRLLGEKLITLTPPRTQKQGKDRVAKDIAKIIIGMDPEKMEHEQYVLKGDTNIVKAFVNKQGVVYGVDKTLYRPDATLDEISEFHQKQRLANGRVTDAGTMTRNIGRWKFLTKLIVPKETLAEYIAGVQDRLGRAKGGWAKGPIALGSKVSQWIGVHARTAGEFVNGLQLPNPSVEFINKSEWASAGDQDRVMENAIQSRIRDMKASIAYAIKDAGKHVSR